MKPLTLWLTKCHGGRYLLTVLPPRIHRIRGTPHMDAFEELGEPIATRYLCEAGIVRLIGAPLPALTPTRIRLSAELVA